MKINSSFVVAVWAVLFLACPVASAWAANGHGGRLEPAERQRLRGDLRQQAFEERLRMRDERMRMGVQPNGAAGGNLGQRGGAGNLQNPGAGSPPPPGNSQFDPRSTGASPANSLAAYPPGPRLSPDERQQLRRQLREARGHGGDGLSGTPAQ